MSGSTLTYTIAWTPTAGSGLARLGADWFGWCAERGERHDQPEFAALPRGFAEIVCGGGLSCLNAPLAAPVERPAEDGSRFALEAQVARAAERLTAVEIGSLQVVRRAEGLALAPCVPSVALARAMRCVAEALGTAPAADFAMPLTGPVSELEAEILSARLTCLLRPELRRGHRLGELTLLAQAAPGLRAVIAGRFETGGPLRADVLPATGPLMLAPERRVRSIA